MDKTPPFINKIAVMKQIHELNEAIIVAEEMHDRIMMLRLINKRMKLKKLLV